MKIDRENRTIEVDSDEEMEDILFIGLFSVLAFVVGTVIIVVQALS